MHAQPTPTAPADAPPLNDFNDLAAQGGQEQVRKRIERALSQAGAIEDAPAPRAAPHYTLDKGGVWFHDVDKDGAPSPPHWICAPLEVVAKTRDHRSEEWGRLLRWHDADGEPHTWAAPIFLMVGDGRDFARELASRGLDIAPGAQAMKRLLAYAVTEPAKARARCVTAPGWHGRQYVLPTGATFGAADDVLVYQHGSGLASHYGHTGDWRANVATLCAGNNRLVLAVSSMFAAPLLTMARVEGGGFHFVGSSSTGKSTILKVAASVAGSPRYVREWRVTANGLEGIATLHNDSTLILDEISQMDAGQAGEAVYLLANGIGKSRATRSGDARAPATWTVQTLSAGEIGLAQHMAQVGKKARAGQTVRLVDIPADAGAGFGAFQNLHGAERADTFAVRLGLMASEHYGTAWHPWLDYITATAAQSLPMQLRRGIEAFKKDYVPEGADGQVIRVAARFGLCAEAGELATLRGLTGWPAGEARSAAVACFRDWLRLRGGAHNGEHIALLSQVRAFFEAYGNSRFDPKWPEERHRLATQRAGFKGNDNKGQPEYLVLPEAFKSELCKGFDYRQAARWLIANGWLNQYDQGHFTTQTRIRAVDGAEVRMRLFSFNAAAVHGDPVPGSTASDE